MHPSGQTSLCSSRFSLSSIQERYVRNSVSPLLTHPEQNSLANVKHDSANETAHDSANEKPHDLANEKVDDSSIHISLEKSSKDLTDDNQCIPHQLLDTGTIEDDITSPQQKTFTTTLEHSEIPITANKPLSHLFNKEVAMGKKKRQTSTDSIDSAPKKEKSSSSTFKMFRIFKKNKSKVSIHATEKPDDDIEMAQLEMSLGKSLEESETMSTDDEHKTLSPSGMSGDLEMVTPWARMSSSNLTQGTMPPSPPVKTIVIPRSQNKKLGIALGQSKNGSGPPFVKNLDPDGLAAKDGRISLGNFIMKVNNEPLVNCSAKDAASIIRVSYYN